jgi:hypothetical protein
MGLCVRGEYSPHPLLEDSRKIWEAVLKYPVTSSWYHGMGYSKHRNSNRWLPFIVCRPRKTDFRFPFALNKRKFAVSGFHFRKQITSVCFFENKWTNNKLLLARWVNGKRIKKNRLGFRFLLETAAYSYTVFMYYMFIHMLQFHYVYMETGKRKFVFLGRGTINGNKRLQCQQTCPSMHIYIYIYIYIIIHKCIYICIYREKKTCCHLTKKFKRKRKTVAQAIFLNLFTVFSSSQWNFVICPLADEETNRSYLFANGLNGLNGLAHLWNTVCPWY